MAWSMMNFLYLKIVTTASRRWFRCRTSILFPWILFMHWRKNGLSSWLIGTLGNISQNSLYNMVVDWHRLSHSWKHFILKCITDIQSPGSDSMHTRDSSFDSEGVNIFHWTVGLIKINTLNLGTPIYTVECKKSNHSNSHPL